MEMHAMLGSSGKLTGGIKAPMFDGSQVCAQTDPEIFFPELDKGSRLTINIARKLCESCEFKAPCLEYAMSDLSIEGIWAGTTLGQREDLRAHRNKLKLTA